jgi:hypothetical protein
MLKNSNSFFKEHFLILGIISVVEYPYRNLIEPSYNKPN